MLFHDFASFLKPKSTSTDGPHRSACNTHQICKKNSYFLTYDYGCFTECITHIQDISILTELKTLSSFLLVMPSNDNDVEQRENNTNKRELKKERR